MGWLKVYDGVGVAAQELYIQILRMAGPSLWRSPEHPPGRPQAIDTGQVQVSLSVFVLNPDCWLYKLANLKERSFKHQQAKKQDMQVSRGGKREYHWQITTWPIF